MQVAPPSNTTKVACSRLHNGHVHLPVGQGKGLFGTTLKLFPCLWAEIAGVDSAARPEGGAAGVKLIWSRVSTRFTKVMVGWPVEELGLGGW